MLYKKAFHYFFFTVISVICLFLILAPVFDPYMLFHDKWFKKGLMYNNMRVQSYGLINHEKMDGIVIGTSMMQNTSAKEASDKLNGHFINLSDSGLSYFERLIILNYAIQKQPLKRIIMSLDFRFFDLREINNSFFPKLYTQSTLAEKYKYYMHSTPLKCLFLNICKSFTKYDTDSPGAWYTQEGHSHRFGGFENWIKYKNEAKKDFRILKSEEKNMDNIDLKVLRDIVDTEIVPLIANNPNIQFDMPIPPYSILWWKTAVDLPKIFDGYEYAIQQLDKYPNVKIYWFYDEKYPTDISFYKDLTHYHQSINSLQIDAIKNQTHFINAKNYQQKLKAWRDKIEKFDIKPYIDQIP